MKKIFIYSRLHGFTLGQRVWGGVARRDDEIVDARILSGRDKLCEGDRETDTRFS